MACEPDRHGVRKNLVLEAIWTHAKDETKKDQEARRKEREAATEAELERLRRFYLPRSANDNNEGDDCLAA